MPVPKVIFAKENDIYYQIPCPHFAATMISLRSVSVRIMMSGPSFGGSCSISGLKIVWDHARRK